jgi:hypothetical protein
MGERPIRAMHGYHPTDKHSYAALFTNQQELPVQVSAIPEIFKLMTFEAEHAFAKNESFLPASNKPEQILAQTN